MSFMTPTWEDTQEAVCAEVRKDIKIEDHERKPKFERAQLTD